MPALLTIEGVSMRFGAYQALDRIDLEIQQGEFVALLGPSGCGKTTLLRSIAGFLRPESGRILIEGQDISRLAAHHRPLNTVFQNYALFPHMSVLENVAYGPRRQGASKQTAAERARSALDMVGLADFGPRYPREMSGGQQQRVALARALAPRPALLLLDEPFSNLDVDLRERLGQEVRGILRAQGTTAILVTHDQYEAFAMADEIGVMHQGTIAQWGDAHTLYHRPATRFVAGFIGQGVWLPGRRRGSDIDLALGTLPCRAATLAGSATLADPNGEVEVLIRPDDLVHDEASPLRAQVTDKAFRGANILYTLRLADGSRVLALVPSHHDVPVGATLGLRVEADDVVAFPALDAAPDQPSPARPA